MTEVPVVFISSTCEDLKQMGHRDAARDAAISTGFFPEMQEYWAARDNPPLKECMTRVDKADVLVVVVAHRFGWVPHKQPAKDRKKHKSITWLECENARKARKDVLVFLVDEEHAWASELREEHELVLAVQAGRLTAKRAADIQWRVNRLKDFKKWLAGEKRTRVTFTTAEDLRGKIESSLRQWREDRHMPEGPPVRVSDPDRYLRVLRSENSHIDIRGFEVASGRAQRFPIDDLYIPLKTVLAEEPQKPSRGRKADKEMQLHMEERRPIELDNALKHRCLVILGDPGAGKTTFLRRIAYGLCNSRLGLDGKTTAETLALDNQSFPMLIRISDLVKHIRLCHGKDAAAPHTENSPAWLAHFMAATSAEGKLGLDREFFEETIETGRAVVLLDGLDETPTRQQRETVADLVARAAGHFEKCRFVVTTRPQGFEGKAVLDGFAQVSIDPLEDGAIEGFLTRWCRAIFNGDEREAGKHCEELLHAVRSRAEIRRMARNATMLTALAVVHWHQKQLPEQRAELYESIITWLSRAREKREGRASPETCVRRLQKLAMAMHNHPEGRQVQVPRRWAAEQIAEEWGDPREPRYVDAAEQFLAEEEIDSGIVVRRGDDIRFWHLTFQEFLAARAIAGQSESKQIEILLAPSKPRVYTRSWREAVLLLAGILHKQGRPKVDVLISTVLERTCQGGSLAKEARCAGLLGAAVRDLTPVGYRPADPRYQELFDRVMGIFDVEKAKGIDIKVIIEAAEALGQAGDPRFVDSARAENWVTIPAGEFLMGAQESDPSKPNHDPEAQEGEAPVHRVSLAPYRIGRYPVTVGEYLRFVEAEGYETQGFWGDGGFGKWETPEGWVEQLEHPTRPVVGVSWHEASAYAAWMGCRLPTEAQWERAARGLEGRRYPWGNDKPDPSRLNYFESKINCPTPVGVYTRGGTPDGILDMAGNVWEWCSDWFAEYPKTGVKDPKGPPSGSGRVLRGGSWFSNPWFCRCSYRIDDDPDVRSVILGFRLVSVSFGLGSSE